MKLSEVIDEIENPEISLKLNFASSLNVFLQAARLEPAVKKAWDFLLESPDNRRISTFTNFGTHKAGP